MAFIVNPTNDPVLRRSERISRYGSMAPAMGWALLNLFLTIAPPFVGSVITRSGYVASVIVFVIVGEVIVWIGMANLRSCGAWDCGITTYLWSGGLLTSIVVGGTLLSVSSRIAYAAALLPWVAPVVASVARRRLVRGRRGESAA